MAKSEPEQPDEAAMEEIKLLEQLESITPDTVFKPNYWAKEDIIGDIHLWAMTEAIITGATDKIRKGSNLWNIQIYRQPSRLLLLQAESLWRARSYARQFGIVKDQLEEALGSLADKYSKAESGITLFEP